MVATAVPRNMGPSPMTFAVSDAQLAAMVRETSKDAVAAAVAAHSSQLAELLRGGQVNDVLYSGLVILDVNGQFQMDFVASYATVMAYNLDAATVTIVQGPNMGTLPNLTGPASLGGAKYAGVHPLLTHTGRLFPVVGGSLAIYGAAAAQVDLTVYATLQPGSPT
jgi:hypothetical protein